MGAPQASAFLFAFASLCASGALPEFLLPGDVVPTKERLELTIEPARNTFQGIARIDINLRQPRSEIWLNGKDLSVSSALLEFRGTSYKTRARAIGGEFIRLSVGKSIGPGPAALSIRYRAPLSSKAVSGPFRKKVEGRWYAFTVFTPIDARRAFPCFDEPRFKIPWELSIRLKRGEKAFANAPEIDETPGAKATKLINFAATKPLPAEVVAFAVGPFDVWDGGRAGARQIPVRVITPQGHREEGKEAALATSEILPRLEEYTGLPYPWQKLDHIALPAGAFGATENPGLITYRSRGLLIPPGDVDSERSFAVRAVEAHEIAHQWFGNLVTQAAWNDVWLSEGFATWLAAKVMDLEEPYPLRRLSAITARERIIAADQGPATRPVRLAMNNRDDMKSVYNRIVYQKGAAILLMLENWLGEGGFQKALQSYLRQHEFATATTADLEAALEDATNIEVKPVMESFLDQHGVPSLRAGLRCETGAPPRITFEQTNPAASWTIPVCWRAEGIEARCTLLDSRRVELDLPERRACPVWIFPNASGAGYYRISWTDEQLSSLANSLNQLSAAERLTLTYDLAALSRSGSGRSGVAELILRRLAADAETQIAHAARVALGLETEPERQRTR